MILENWEISAAGMIWQPSSSFSWPGLPELPGSSLTRYNPGQDLSDQSCTAAGRILAPFEVFQLARSSGTSRIFIGQVSPWPGSQ